MTPALVALSLTLAVVLPDAGAAAFPLLLLAVACVDAVLVSLELAEPDQPVRRWWEGLAHYVEPGRLVPWAVAAWLPVLDVWSVPVWLAAPALAVAMDAERYVLHVASHRVPVLWAMHRAHHATAEPHVLNRRLVNPLDVTTFNVTGVVAAMLGCPGPVLAAAMALHLPAMLQHCSADLDEYGLGSVLLLGRHHREHHRDGGQAVWCGLWLTVWDRLGRTTGVRA